MARSNSGFESTNKTNSNALLKVSECYFKHLSNLKLSPDEKRRISLRIQKEKKSQEKFFTPQYLDEKFSNSQSLYEQKRLDRNKAKLRTMLQVFFSQLDTIGNFFRREEARVNEFEYFARRILKGGFSPNLSAKLKYSDNEQPLISLYSLRTDELIDKQSQLKKHLFSLKDKQAFSHYSTILDNRDSISSNWDYALSYYEEFEEFGFLENLQKAIDLLQSATYVNIHLSSKESGYSIGEFKFSSKNPFCAFNKRIIGKQRKKQIQNVLYELHSQGKAFSLLTLSYDNLKYTITTKDWEVKAKIEKEFFDRARLSEENASKLKNKIPQLLQEVSSNPKFSQKQKDLNIRELTEILPTLLEKRPRISDFIQGTYGVPEIVEHAKDTQTKSRFYDETEFNLHTHRLCVRENDFERGFLSKYYITAVFQQTCENQNYPRLSKSFIVDIRKADFDTINYLHAYFWKGLKTQTSEGRRSIIRATKGKRYILSTGLLALNKQKDVATKYEISSIVRFAKSNSFTEDFDLGKTLFNRFKPFPFDQDKRNQILYTLQQYNHNEHQFSEIHYKYNTKFFQEVKSHLFDKQKITCPLSSKVLHFRGTKKNSFRSDVEDPFFLRDALYSLASKSKIEEDKINETYQRIHEFSIKNGLPTQDEEYSIPVSDYFSMLDREQLELERGVSSV